MAILEKNNVPIIMDEAVSQNYRDIVDSFQFYLNNGSANIFNGVDRFFIIWPASFPNSNLLNNKMSSQRQLITRLPNLVRKNRLFDKLFDMLCHSAVNKYNPSSF